VYKPIWTLLEAKNVDDRSMPRLLVSKESVSVVIQLVYLLE
jgi:hypothetical protein